VSAVSKDDEVKAIVADLDGLLDELRLNVDTVTAILVPPASDNGCVDGHEAGATCLTDGGAPSHP